MTGKTPRTKLSRSARRRYHLGRREHDEDLDQLGRLKAQGADFDPTTRPLGHAAEDVWHETEEDSGHVERQHELTRRVEPHAEANEQGDETDQDAQGAPAQRSYEAHARTVDRRAHQHAETDEPEDREEQRFTPEPSPLRFAQAGFSFHQRTLNRARESTAQSTATTQKRATMRVSGMPASWKAWWIGVQRKTRFLKSL